MTRPSFLEGAGVALIVALAGSLGYSVLHLALPAVPAGRVLVPLIGLAYLLYLLGRSETRVGRLTTLAGWLLGAALLWLLAPSLVVYLGGHLALAWLARSLYLHGSPLAALADLGLTGLALVAAAGSWLHTGSLFVALWTLFLIQALVAFIPAGGRDVPSDHTAGDPFERAHAHAEAALHQLTLPRTAP